MRGKWMKAERPIGAARPIASGWTVLGHSQRRVVRRLAMCYPIGTAMVFHRSCGFAGKVDVQVGVTFRLGCGGTGRYDLE